MKKQQLYCESCKNPAPARFNIVWGENEPPVVMCVECDNKESSRRPLSWCLNGDESELDIVVQCLANMDAVSDPAEKKSSSMITAWINVIRRFFIPGFEDIVRTRGIKAYQDWVFSDMCVGSDIYASPYLKEFLAEHKA